MNIKTLFMSTVAVVSASVLGVSAFAASANVSGYEALKRSGFALLDIGDNYTVSVDLSFISNGQAVFSGNLLSQSSGSPDATFNRLDAYISGEGSFWIEDFRNSGHGHTVTSHSPNHYIVTNSFHAQRLRSLMLGDFSLSENQARLIGVLIDMSVGETKNYFVMDGNTVSVSLSRNQMPELLQSFLPVVMEASNHIFSQTPASHFVLDDIMRLNDPAIESSSLTAIISDDGLIEELNMSVDFSGVNEDGGAYNATINIDMSFSDIGETVVRLFDPSGKTELDTQNFDFNAIDLNSFNFDSIDLNGFDFDSIDLNGFDLNSIDLNSFDLNSIDLNGFNLDQIDLQNFDSSILEQVSEYIRANTLE